MRRTVVFTALLGGLAWAAPAAPTTARCAACVAALKARAEPLAQRLKRGDNSAEVPLMPIVVASYAFVGTVYKQGVRSPQADELLRRAEQAQASLPPADLARLQDACQLEGEQLLKDANSVERMIVNRAARSRIDKLRKK